MHPKEPVIIAHVQSDILSMCYTYIHENSFLTCVTIIKRNVAMGKNGNLHRLVKKFSPCVLTQIPSIPATIVCNLHAPTNDGEQAVS